MDIIRRHFETTFDKTGIALTISQLLTFAKEKKLTQIKAADIARLVSNHPDIAKFSPARRPRRYQSIGVLRPGIYFIDYGEYEKQHAFQNGGNTGFLVAVENLTNRLFVQPCKDKATPSWLEAIRQFIELTRNVNTIYSDRDAVATSPRFMDKIFKDYGVRWHFLKKGSKSYLAERYIGFTKQKLSQAVLHRKQQQQNAPHANSGTNNWTQFVPALVSAYNTQKIDGTSYSRQSIDQHNFSHFLSQFLGTKEPELEFNASKAGPFAHDAWNRKIFKFNLGQKVLLARRANWKKATGDTDSRAHYGVFMKASTVGGFGDKRFTVSGRQLRKRKGFKEYVAVYSLQEMSPSLHFYEWELKSVDVSTTLPDSDTVPTPPPKASSSATTATTDQTLLDGGLQRPQTRSVSRQQRQQ